jgi:hypothetical protein
MRRVLMMALTSGALIAAAPAMATMTVNGGEVTFSGVALPSDFYTVNFVADGFSDITSTLTLTYTGTSGTSYLFDYLVTNNSSPTTSRLSVFGFDVSPTTLSVTNSSVTDPNNIFNQVSSGQIENENVSVCFDNSQPHNCNSSSAGIGVLTGTSDSGTLSLNFASPLPTSITLSDFLLKYQSIGPDGASALGRPTSVPEPATWAMMLLGFGGIGMAMRRRRSKQGGALAQIA